MAFIALYGWIFFLMVPAFFIGVAAEAALTWAAAHVFLANVALAALLALNLLGLRGLLKIRAKWKREGTLKASPIWRDPSQKGLLKRFCLFYGLFLESSVALICLAFLLFQPIPYLAERLL